MQGLVCFWCCGLTRRRYKGWKLREVKTHIDESEANREEFKTWRLADIDFVKRNGWQYLSAHITDGGVNTSKVKLKSRNEVVEGFPRGARPQASVTVAWWVMTSVCSRPQASVGVVRCVWVGDHSILRRRTPRFHMKGDLLWSEDAFLKRFGQTGKEAGKTWERKVFADGSVLEGYRTSDDEKRPLPEGCTAISRTYNVVVGLETSQKESEDMDNKQMVKTAKVHAKRNLGSVTGPDIEELEEK